MLALYHFDRSTAAQKVRIALAEKGLAWESRYVDPGLDKRQQHDPEYLKLNPRGLVPTLIHDGCVVREFSGDPRISRGCLPRSAAAPG